MMTMHTYMCTYAQYTCTEISLHILSFFKLSLVCLFSSSLLRACVCVPCTFANGDGKE